MNSVTNENSRWIILAFAAFTMFGNYYCFDLPAAMKDSIHSYFELQFSKETYEYLYNTLFTAYSLPNIFLPFINGYLVDKIGSGTMLVALSFAVFIGQALFWFGTVTGSMSLMIFSRVVAGIGGESLFVALSNFITKYFRTKELSLALGLTLAIGNLGSMMNMIITPRVCGTYGIRGGSGVGALVSLFSFVVVLVSNYIDKHIAAMNQMGRGLSLHRPASNTKGFREVLTDLLNFKEFSSLYWSICACSFFLFTGILSFNNIAASYILNKWFSALPLQTAEIQASNYVSLMWLTTVIGGPLVGCLVDEYGVRTRLAMIAAVILGVGQLSMIVFYPTIPVVLIGVAYSIGYAAIGPSVAYLTDAEDLGRANGILYSLQNFGFFIVPYFVATLKNSYGTYDSSQVFLAAFAGVALYFGYKSYMENTQKGHVLELRIDQLQDVRGAGMVELKEVQADYNPLMDSDQEYEDAKRMLDFNFYPRKSKGAFS